jgi:hypothetical protein
MPGYYYIDNASKQQCGPFAPSELLRKGIRPATIVWRSGMADWAEAGTLQELNYLFDPEIPAPQGQKETGRALQQAGVVIIGLALLVGGSIYFLFSPEESAYFPQCPFHRLTGLDCPGCGAQRAIHHLLHFRLKEAFFSNPLMVSAIPYIMAGACSGYSGGKERFPKACKILFGKAAIIAVLVIFILFWIGRNII